MSYEFLFFVLFLVGLLMQSSFFSQPSASGLLVFMGQDTAKNGRTLCFVGGLGLSVMFLGVELFLVVFTIVCCAIAYISVCLSRSAQSPGQSEQLLVGHC